jgi:hypothetical protein
MMYSTPLGQGLLCIIASCAALLCSCAAGAGANPQAYEFDAGFDAAPQSLYWYKEAVVALNRDMSKDGYLFRMYGSLAAYQYAKLHGGGDINGRLWQFDLMPGYQIVRGAATFGGYVGFDYQDAELSPEDPTSTVRGTQTGLKVAGNVSFKDDKQPIEASLVSEYSTAFDTYYAELRVGVKISKGVFIGPAGEVDGDNGYNGQRLGGYFKYAFDIAKGVSLELDLAGGHQFISGSNGGGDRAGGVGGGAGTYGTIEISTDF